MAEGVPIYKINVDGQERKAIDLVSLKNFLESKRLESSLLNINLDNLEDDESLYKLTARTAMQALNEIESAIDNSLGLNQPSGEGEQEEPEQPEQEEQPTQDTTQPEPPQQPQAQPQQQQESGEEQQQPTQPVDESEDRLVL